MCDEMKKQKIILYARQRVLKLARSMEYLHT